MAHAPLAGSPAKAGSPGVARRLAAMAYEMLLLAGVVAAALVFPHLLLGAFAHRIATPTLLWAHLFIVLLAYCVGFWSNGHQTLAMKTWRLRIVTRSGERLRPAQALWRYLLCWPSLCLGGIGILWALLDHDRQFLHDRLAGTRIVYA